MTDKNRNIPPGERISLKPGAAKAIDQYWEYSRIVGNDDGGTPFTPEEYEKYKKEVLPMRLKNRVYVAWVNSTGMDCTLIGPETACFCKHRYKQHQTDFKEIPNTRPILLPCKEAGCPCVTFNYLPRNGSQPIRCGCKHTSDEHRLSKPFNCLKCFKLDANAIVLKARLHAVDCSEPCYGHTTLAETKDEREARGHPIGNDVPYQAMGGITGFSSLAEGYLRLDPSGRGRPDDSFFNQAIAQNDHPFLRQFAHTDLNRNSGGELLDKSAERRNNESELDYFERRYKERMKLEKTNKPKPIQSSPYDDDAKLSTGVRNSNRANKK